MKKNMRILYVEDDELLRFYYGQKIEELLSAKVVLSSSANEASSILKNDKDFTVIVSDMEMPNGTGLDLFAYLVNHQIEIPFVFFTSAINVRIPLADGTLLPVIPKPYFILLAEEIKSRALKCIS